MIFIKKKTNDYSKKEAIEALQRQRTKRPLFTTILIIALLFILATGLSGCVSLFQESFDSGNVALIHVEGPIGSSSSMFSSEGVSSPQVIDWLKEANDDDEVQAIVIDINSGGGRPVASEEIAKAIKDSKKPTVAIIHDIGASGAYWVASASDHLIASDLSLVGSIGVIGSYLDFSGFLYEHNVSYNRAVAGKYKDMGSPFKEMTSDERIKNQLLLDKMHEIFIKSVAENRNLSYGAVKQLATGELFLGVDALQNGLIDELGGISELKNYLKEELDIDVVDFKDYKPRYSFLEELSNLGAEIGTNIGLSLGNSLVETSSRANNFKA